jgi:predicted nucleic-acid-binding protein
MIGLDTNILVRYLAQDDPVQSAKATEIIERRLTEENPGFVSVVAMVETVWVLDRAYGLGSDEIAAAIERTLQIDALVVEKEQEVFTAMIALKQGKGSFADAIILALGARAGCSYTLTFDQKASRLSGFRLAWPTSRRGSKRQALDALANRRGVMAQQRHLLKQEQIRRLPENAGGPSVRTRDPQSLDSPSRSHPPCKSADLRPQPHLRAPAEGK